MSRRAHCWEGVALSLNPTRLLPETITLCRLPVRPVLQGSGLALGCSPSEVVLTTSPCPLLPQSYTPTVFERFNVTLQVKGEPVELQIWDTAGVQGPGRDRVEGGAPAAGSQAPLPSF